MVNFNVSNVKLQVVESYKYLGISLNYCLDYNYTTELLASAGSQALGQLIAKTKTNYDLSYNTFTKLFEITVIPVMEYAVGAWYTSTNVSDFRKIDMIQNRAMHFFCGVPRTCPIGGLAGDMGWIPGVIRPDLDCLRMFNEFVKMDPNCLTKRIFMYDWNHSNHHSWLINVKKYMC